MVHDPGIWVPSDLDDGDDGTADACKYVQTSQIEILVLGILQ